MVQPWARALQRCCLQRRPCWAFSRLAMSQAHPRLFSSHLQQVSRWSAARSLACGVPAVCHTVTVSPDVVTKRVSERAAGRACWTHKVVSLTIAGTPNTGTVAPTPAVQLTSPFGAGAQAAAVAAAPPSSLVPTLDFSKFCFSNALSDIDLVAGGSTGTATYPAHRCVCVHICCWPDDEVRILTVATVRSVEAACL